MARAEHRFEGIAGGAAIDTANSDGPAGDAYTSVTGTVVAVTQPVGRGYRAFQPALSASTNSECRSTSLGSATLYRYRGLLYLTSAPPGNVRFARTRNATVVGCQLGLNSSRQLRLQDSAGTLMATVNTPVPLDQWVRVEARMLAHPTAGQASVSLWLDPDSTGLPSDEASSAAAFNTGSAFDEHCDGLNATALTYSGLVLDETVWSTVDTAIGPKTAADSRDFDFDAVNALSLFDQVVGSVTPIEDYLRMDGRAGDAFLRWGVLNIGPGRRWASVRFRFRLPLGIISSTVASIVRFRNTNPVSGGGGGNGDISVNASGLLGGDLQPSDAFTSSVAIQPDTWYALEAVCSFQDAGNSSLKVRIDGTDVGNIVSTVTAVGDALDNIQFGQFGAVNRVVDYRDMTLRAADQELAYVGAYPSVTGPETGSPYQLLAILDDARQSWQAERAAPPVACPNDGEPLRTGPDGRLYCPFDGWRP
ncbi:MAG: hypothetical protein L0Y54_08340 [Sporichthyaceae bacterium]|nr:hypothetical protein [Sporichthyaceae bacterium]